MSGSSISRSVLLNPRDQPRRIRIRWLLRALVEPAFLRLYLDLDGDPPTLRAFEDAFFSLESDAERLEEHRGDAWKQLKEWVGSRATSSPAAWFCAVLQGLRSGDYAEGARDLGRFWALGELFDDGIGVANQPEVASEAPPYHEIHCHLRGGIPFLALWHGFVQSDRKRAALRRYSCESGIWQKTWAELVADAAKDRTECLSIDRAHPDPGQAEAAYLRTLVQRVVGSNLTEPPVHPEPAVRYLATCAGLSAFLLHQRGTAGLSHFVDSYERYAKVQKVRGGPERGQTRELVAATLRRFEIDGVAAVELRPTLERRRRDLQRKLQDVVLGYFDYLATTSDDRPPIAMGLVPSLFKQEPPNKTEPTDPAFWESQQEIWCDQVRGLLAILEDSAALRWFIVGLDAAGKERGCPPRVFRAAFDLVRAYNRGRALARPGRRMSASFLRKLRQQNDDSGDALDELDEKPVYPVRLGITVHAGEDFEDPLTGLRHIWETAVDLELGEGDRIGHALAAGLDEEAVRTLLERRSGDPGGEVKQLEKGTFVVRKPRGTHLLDLAWIWQVGGQQEVRDAELRLGEIAARAFGTPAGTAHFARELARPGALTRAALPGIRFRDPKGLGAHDIEAVVIDTAWLALIESLRGRVLDELVRRRIVVESCPTSNLVVANLDEPPLRTLAKKAGLRVAMATDDPGLLGVFPCAEMIRFQDEDDAFRKKLLETAARASFVTRVEDGHTS